MREIEVVRAYGPIGLTKLCLVLSVIVPKMFKVPKFEEYNGSTNLKTYITGYYQEMTEIAYDDKFLIHFFHKSLTGVMLKWYI